MAKGENPVLSDLLLTDAKDSSILECSSPLAEGGSTPPLNNEHARRDVKPYKIV